MSESLWLHWSRRSQPNAFEWSISLSRLGSTIRLLSLRLACCYAILSWFDVRWLVHPASSPSIGKSSCRRTSRFPLPCLMLKTCSVGSEICWPSRFLQPFFCYCFWAASRYDTKCWLLKLMLWNKIEDLSMSPTNNTSGDQDRDMHCDKIQDDEKRYSHRERERDVERCTQTRLSYINTRTHFYKNNLWGIVLGHNRSLLTQWKKTKNGNETDRMLMWKTLIGKNHGNP